MNVMAVGGGVVEISPAMQAKWKVAARGGSPREQEEAYCAVHDAQARINLEKREEEREARLRERNRAYVASLEAT